METAKQNVKKERNFSMNEMMKVLYIQVGKMPLVIEIKHTLKERFGHLLFSLLAIQAILL